MDQSVFSDLRPVGSAIQGQSASIDKIAPAMAAAMRGIINPKKNRKAGGASKNGGAGKTYAYTTLSLVNDTIREPLADNGLFPTHSVQATTMAPLTVVTRIMHESGQWLESVLPLRHDGSNPQAMGSAITYAKRYNLCALLNISSDEDDDDGAAASHRRDDRQEEPHRDKVGNALYERFQRMIRAAQAAQSGIDMHDVMKSWQRDMDEFMAMRSNPERARGWASLMAFLPEALSRVFGKSVALAWVDAIEANTLDDVRVIKNRWNGEWAAEILAMKQAHAQAYGLLAEHMRVQEGRVKDTVQETEVEAEQPQSGYQASLIDEHGEVAEAGPWEDECAFARAYSNLLLGTSDPRALEEYNADALVECLNHPQASEILAEIGSPPPPPPPQQIEAIEMPMNRSGNPDLAAYLTLVQEGLAGLDKTTLPIWCAANAPTYESLPQGTKLRVIKAVGERKSALGIGL